MNKENAQEKTCQKPGNKGDRRSQVRHCSRKKLGGVSSIVIKLILMEYYLCSMQGARIERKKAIFLVCMEFTVKLERKMFVNNCQYESYEEIILSFTCLFPDIEILVRCGVLNGLNLLQGLVLSSMPSKSWWFHQEVVYPFSNPSLSRTPRVSISHGCHSSLETSVQHPWPWVKENWKISQPH